MSFAAFACWMRGRSFVNPNAAGLMIDTGRADVTHIGGLVGWATIVQVPNQSRQTIDLGCVSVHSAVSIVCDGDQYVCRRRQAIEGA